MFSDIKDQPDNPAVLKIIAYSEYEASIERAKQKAAEFRRHESWQLYGWVENGEIVGVCGFEVHTDYVEIHNIAVAENIRHHGVGGKMITALWNKYEMAIEAETDDDAVDFYRKLGFSAAATQKYGVRRWTCVLAAPKPPDHETDKERQARIYPIILSEYNPAWPEWYAEEKSNLERLIGTETIARISHYGSTSVPGLTAKPTVDILLEITEDANLSKIIDALSSPEYICLYPPDMPTPPPHLMFLKGYLSDGFAEKVYHIHVRYPGDPDELYFRDYLIAHPETALEYTALKTRLHKGFEHDRDGYTDAKDSVYPRGDGESKEAMKKPYVISISGLSGSGKTAVTCALKAQLANATIISFDDYGDRIYLERDINEWSKNSSDDEWHTEPIAADVERLLNEPLDYIILDYPFGYGNRLVGQYIDLTVFIDVPLDVALARRIIRDYTSRGDNTNVADVDEISLAGLDKELRFYLERSRSTYARMPEMQKAMSDLVVDGMKTPIDIADDILSHIETLNCPGAADSSYIRLATESDLHCVLNMDPFRRTTIIHHAIKHGDCFIAVYDGIIKGFAIMNYTFFDNAFIELLMVEEKYRQCGIGSTLLRFLFAECKTQKLFTSTNKSNEPMRKLLGKAGFTLCGEIDALDEGDPELFFAKKKVAK